MPGAADRSVPFTVTLADGPSAPDGTRSGGREVFTGTVSLPVIIAGDATDLVRPVESEPIARALRQCLSPLLLTDADGTLSVELFPGGTDRVHIAMAATPELTLALRLELLAGPRVVGTGEVWWRLDTAGARTHLYPHYTRVQLTRVGGPAAGETMSLRLVGDPVVALRNFDADRCWAGEIEVPVP